MRGQCVALFLSQIIFNGFARLVIETGNYNTAEMCTADGSSVFDHRKGLQIFSNELSNCTGYFLVFI